MSDFEDIAEAFNQSEDVRVKTKREILAPHLEARKANHLRRRNEVKCFVTKPYGHYYDQIKITGDVARRVRCLNCHRLRAKPPGGRDNLIGREGTAFIAAVIVFLVALALFLWA